MSKTTEELLADWKVASEAERDVSWEAHQSARAMGKTLGELQVEWHAAIAAHDAARLGKIAADAAEGEAAAVAKVAADTARAAAVAKMVAWRAHLVAEQQP